MRDTINPRGLVHAIVLETLTHMVGDAMGPEFMDHEEHLYSEARKDCCFHLLAVYTHRGDCDAEFKPHVEEIVAKIKDMDVEEFSADPFFEYENENQDDVEERVQKIIEALES